jgi:hypothetical protein
MTGRNRFACFFAVSAFLLTCLASSERSSWAYIPPSAFLVKSVARKHLGYKRIRVKSEIQALDRSGQPTGIHFHEQLTYVPASGTLKSTATDDSGTVLFETVRGDESISPAALLLFAERSALIGQSLKGLDIPILTEFELEALHGEDERRAAESERLGRLGSSTDHQVAWVVGRAAPEGGSALLPQVWIEKDTFLPLRLIGAVRKGDSALEDIRYGGYRTYSEFPYPKLTTWFDSDGTPHLRSQTIEVAVDGAPESARSKKSSLNGNGNEDGWSLAGQSAPGAQRDLIRDFYSTLR